MSCSRYCLPSSFPPHACIAAQYVLPLDPADLNGPEADDKLHNPDPLRDRKNDKGGHILTGRGFMNLGCIFILTMGILTLLYVAATSHHFLLITD